MQTTTRGGGGHTGKAAVSTDYKVSIAHYNIQFTHDDLSNKDTQPTYRQDKDISTPE
jgi:hypothetical protein